MQQLSPELLFETAAEVFLSMRTFRSPNPSAARYVRVNTEKAYRRQIASLSLFFAGMTMREISWYHMKAYQEARVCGAHPFIRRRRPQEEPGPCPCKPAQVNQELSFLKRLKKLALCWMGEDDRFYVELQEDEGDLVRALTPEEQDRWLAVSRTRPAWEVVHWYSLVAFDTTMSTNELRGLRLGDINLATRVVSIPWPAAKNKYRRRNIAMENADVLWAMERLIGRARGMGSSDHQHFLFPFYESRAKRCDPGRPMSESGLKHPWNEVRQASGLVAFRMYDTRHTGATRLAEWGTPIDIIMARMGHVSERMRQHYTHISLSAQRRWLRKGPQRERVQDEAVESR